MATNVPAITWSNGAPVLPLESAILAGVQADINTAFGGGVNQLLTTPQGQIAQTETAIIGDKNNQIAFIANMINPATSSGIWQDSIGALYGITRIASAGSVVTATCTGAVGTVIPAGSVARDTNGYLYSSTIAATIPASGSISIQFQNQTQGAISTAIGALNTIYSSVAGWDTITNPAVASLGTLQESRAAFELRRQQSVASNANNTLQAIYASVAATSGVIDVFVTDNSTTSAITYGSTNYSIAANSLVVSVAGGQASQVAASIWNKKPPGCGFVGNTTYTVYDNVYNPPYPAYVITWLTPVSTPVYFIVRIVNNPAMPSNVVSLIQNAVVAAFNGTDGGTRARIAQTITAGRYFAGIAGVDITVSILTVTMGLTSAAGLSSLTFGIDQLPTLSPTNVVVTLV